jgi:Sec7-like guanine-nucleotide exchange factor
LEAFQLPKESQQIDRIMESFAQVWFDHNPTVLLHADAVYSLSFSLIMLNVDAHNSYDRLLCGCDLLS